MTATRILGQVLARQQVADVGISRCVPSVPAHDIVEHRHVEAHFIVVERGRYDSLADGAADADLREPLLLFNPPGTEHHDCFAETQVLEEARFSAITIGFAHWQRLSRDLRLPGWPVARQGAASQRSLQRLLQVLHRPSPVRSMPTASSPSSLGLSRPTSNARSTVRRPGSGAVRTPCATTRPSPSKRTA